MSHLASMLQDAALARGNRRRGDTATDFVGGAAVPESHFAVLRDHRSTADDVRDAVTLLLKLRPIGVGGD
jgi:hypothetical protein